MKKYFSFLMALIIVITSLIPTVLLVGTAAASTDVGNVSIEDLEYAYGLRATKDNVSLDYDSETTGYAVTMPSNSKHIFLVSDETTTGKAYTVSVEYMMASTDSSASIGLVFGANKNDDSIDLTTAYKMQIYKNADRLRFSACNGSTPDAVGTNVSFDSNNQNIGVTYNADIWNTVSVSVAEDGFITCFVNNVQVYTTDKLDYIGGHIGLYAYLPGTQFRNFNMVEKTSQNPDGDNDKDDTDDNISFNNFEFAYGLRATAENTYFEYDANTEGYEVKMPSNSKHVFYVSDIGTTGKTYTVSVEYQTSSTDANASIGIVLGAGKKSGTIDLTTAYKMVIYKNSDWLRFSACNGATPDAVGNNVSFDSGNKKNVGVTYKTDEWNTLSVSVSEDGKVTATVNGIQVYTTDKIGYISGYIGLYTYIPGTQFRNFNMVEETSQNPDGNDDKKEFDAFKFAYGLRATAENTYFEYDANTEGYEIKMPSNSKHIFYVSDTKTTGRSYTVTVEYQAASNDSSASVGILLGANKNGETIDLTTAYKMIAYTNQDQLRFSACDYEGDPSAVGASKVSFDQNVKNAGVTYTDNKWNTLSVTVTESGKITCSVNGVEIYNTGAVGYIEGYVGLYAYLPGTRFRNFEFEEFTEQTTQIPDSDGINLAKLQLSYALRATSSDLTIEYNKETGAYKYIVGGSNSKHYFFMSDTKVEQGVTYRISVDYKMTLDDKNASIGFILGAGKNAATGEYDLRTAYKLAAYGNSDSFRFSSCDGETPDITGAKYVSFDSGIKTDCGVTYNKENWNKLVLEVYKDSIVCYVNGIKVYETLKLGNVGGYLGLYSYVTGSYFKNFTVERIAENTISNPAGFFYDLSSQSTVSSVDGRNIATNVEYNQQEGNMTVSANLGLTGSGSTNYATFYLGSNDSTYALPKSDVSCVEYPILAMKIRLNDKTSESGIWKTTTTTSQAAWESDNSIGRWINLGYPTYIQSDDWQIVYIDVSKLGNEYLKGNSCWKNIQFSLVNPYDSISTDKDIFSVEWIGAFSSIKDIRKIDGKTVLNGNYTESGMLIDTSLPGRLFYDFSKISYVNRVTIDANGKPEASTAITYDVANGAMKVSVLPNGTSNGYARFYLGTNSAQYALPATNVSCDEYPVIAMKVMLKNTNLTATGGWLAKADGEDTSWADLKTAVYKQTDEWQVVYIDTRYINVEQKAKLEGNNWKTFSFRMVSNNKYDAKANYLNDEFLIAWFGVFKDAKSACEFGGEVVEESNAKFLYDFSKEGTVSFAEPTAETTVAYDDMVGAMKVSINTAGTGSEYARFYLGKNKALIEKGISCEEYPVIAIRIKLQDPTSISGYFHYKTTATTSYQTFSKDASKNYEIPYQKTSDWQTIIINTAEIDNLQYLKAATWESFSLRLVNAGGASASDDVFWISWIAGFATEQEAVEYSGITEEHAYVAVVGDELTYGIKAANRNAYPINLQTELGSDFTVKSFAAFGATVQDNLAGSFRKTSAYERSINYNPEAVVIMLGTNDSNKVNWTDPEQYKNDLISLIKSYSALDTKPQIYLCTTPYIFDETAPSSLSNSRVKEIVDIQRTVAKELNVQLIDTYNFLKGKNEYYFNGVYLNNTGYPAMASFIADKIKETFVTGTNEHIYKLDSAQAIEKYISWSNQNDTNVSFDETTSSMLVKAVDAEIGSAADQILATNVAGFSLNLDGISTNKYPVAAVHIKLSRPNIKAGWFGFETTSTQEVNSAKKPVYETTTEWQTVIIDFSDPDSNTMISAFEGNWKALSANLGVDNITFEGDSFNVDWVGLFQSVEDAQKHAGIKTENAVVESKEETSFNSLVIIIPICIAAALSITLLAILLIKKRRTSK